MNNVIFIKSLEAKLTLTRETIPVYQELKDVCAVHEGVTSRISFQRDTIYFDKKKVAIIKVSRKNMAIYLALDPKNYESYNVKDVTGLKYYKGCPTMVWIDSNESLETACHLLEEAFILAGATNYVAAEIVDYNEYYQPKSFDELLASGMIKKYVRKGIILDLEEDYAHEDVHVEEVKTNNVHLTCRLIYNAKNNADELYVLTNTNNWDFDKAIKMEMVSENVFEANISVSTTNFEFKVCKALNWDNEVKNHSYIVEKDLEIEDLIHNFK